MITRTATRQEILQDLADREGLNRSLNYATRPLGRFERETRNGRVIKKVIEDHDATAPALDQD